ncbi:DUF317 domain-containing protein [Streptomyces sp. NPDC001739]
MTTTGNFPPHLVYASPRHLAGGGDPRHITAPLIAMGWTATSVAGAPDVRLTSPDRHLKLALTPDPDKPWWTIHTPSFGMSAGPPTWHATFGARTPVEVLAGFTNGLTARPPATAPDPWMPLVAAGWTVANDGNVTATSPDGTATMYEYMVGAYKHWRIVIEHQHVGSTHMVWEANLSGYTPPHLVAGFAAALADSSPVLRSPDAIPLFSRGRVHTTAAKAPGQAEARLRDRVAAARRAASRVRIGQGLRPPGLPPKGITPDSPEARRR